MNKITKDICKNRLSVKLRLIIVILIAILGSLFMWLYTGSIWLGLFSLVLFGALIIYMFYARSKGIMNDDDYYIVEDVFLSVQEKNAVANTIKAVGRHMPKHYDYDIKFSHNGTHRIKLLSKKEPEKLEANYFEVFFSKPGDKFYLMISKRGENKCIVKAFNSKYFKLVEEDFEYIDGKYYPKKG